MGLGEHRAAVGELHPGRGREITATDRENGYRFAGDRLADGVYPGRVHRGDPSRSWWRSGRRRRSIAPVETALIPAKFRLIPSVYHRRRCARHTRSIAPVVVAPLDDRRTVHGPSTRRRRALAAKLDG